MTKPRERSMGELFREAHGQPVTYRGATVYLGYRLGISPGDHVAELTVRSSKVDPVQGICLKMHNGSLVVNNQRSSEVNLWTDTAPNKVTIQISGQPEADLVIWNCWRGKFGQRMEGVGSVGMLVGVDPAGVYDFRCSDGVGEVDFTAIEFGLKLVGN